jgi:quinol monooxygenase YgiN
MAPMIVIAGTIPVDISKKEAIAAACNEMRAATLLEDGCHAYRFAFATDDEATVVIVEEWRDQAALDAHFVAPHMAAFSAQLGNFVAGKGDFSRYDVTDKRPLF